MRLDEAWVLLEIPPDTALDAAKSSYKRLARMHHPDKSDAPDATEKMQNLTAAFSLIERFHSGEDVDADDDGGSYGFGVRDADILDFLAAMFSGGFFMGGGGGGGVGRYGRGGGGARPEWARASTFGATSRGSGFGGGGFCGGFGHNGFGGYSSGFGWSGGDGRDRFEEEEYGFEYSDDDDDEARYDEARFGGGGGGGGLGGGYGGGDFGGIRYGGGDFAGQLDQEKARQRAQTERAAKEKQRFARWKGLKERGNAAMVRTDYLGCELASALNPLPSLDCPRQLLHCHVSVLMSQPSTSRLISTQGGDSLHSGDQSLSRQPQRWLLTHHTITIDGIP